MNIDNISMVSVGARMLETLTSALYADPVVVFREYVQNSFDSVEDRSRLRIVIKVDADARRIEFDDNGDGVEESKFEEVMRSFGRSHKPKESNKIGLHGIGRLAGLSFCNKLTFVNKSFGQTFSLNGEDYRKMLSDPNMGQCSLDEAMVRISNCDCDDKNMTPRETGFRVIMEGVNEELMHVMFGKGRFVAGKEYRGESLSQDFLMSLRKTLPVPYEEAFDKREQILDLYRKFMHHELSSMECDVEINGKKLYKRFQSVPGAFVAFPIGIDASCPDEYDGVIWFSFDYAMRSKGKCFGVDVRSKNMLVQGNQVFAVEAAQCLSAATTYGQYLSANKAVVGELLLNTRRLSDNSRRDWFRLDNSAYMLREIICRIMTSLHKYRYAMSRYVNDVEHSSRLKDAVVLAYNELGDSGKFCELSFLPEMREGREDYSADRYNERYDERDLPRYNKTERNFYITIMETVYRYFAQNKEIAPGMPGYYDLKAYVLKQLNDVIDD